MKQPYIGVTGFMSRAEMLGILTQMPETNGRLIMAGVLASHKTLHQKDPGQPLRYPRISELNRIFVRSQLLLNLIHYNSREEYTLFDQLCQLCEVSGENCHGFQLNMAWPNLWQIQKFRCFHPNMIIVLQVGKLALEKVNFSPQDLAKKIREYECYIDYVLLDPSGGRGQLFDIDKTRTYLTEIRDLGLDIALGIAGGLSADTLSRAIPLITQFPDLSIDAEGLLRDKEDNLDQAKALQYLHQAFVLFHQTPV